MPGDPGVFAVQPEQVTRLGVSFTEFVNALLDVATGAAGLAGAQLRTTHKETVADGGVDAALNRSVRTRWLPEGDSVWQFKRTDLSPAKCKEELRGASWAQERMRAGAKYRLVLGAGLNANKVSNRLAALVEQATALGLPHGPDDIDVLDADALARWATDYPALAVSRLLGGPGQVATDHGDWSRSIRHQSRWVGDADRTALIRSVRELLTSEGVPDARIEGVSGVGKTRLVLEALRDQPVTPLVAYVSNEQSLGSDFVNHLTSGARSVVLVVDECNGRRHEKLAEQIPTGVPFKLITIGDPDTYPIRCPLLSVSPLSEADLEELLKINHPELWPEARRFIAEYCSGNPRFAFLLAEKIRASARAEAALLIDAGDIKEFVTSLLPEGADFLGSALVALFDRVGWDRELRPQMEVLAAFWGVAATALDALAIDLESRGLLARQGRYRAVAPHPLATFLAAEGWRRFGDRIAAELLPVLDPEMSLGLFRRVADLGRFDPARAVLLRLLTADGPFGTLERIEAGGEGRHLTQLAIVMPEDATAHLSEVIEGASLDELRAAGRSRRDLVWTLEKLVWHRATFGQAADALLKLAQAENETYGNNSTATWVDLFGTLLPGTAALPPDRLAYLNDLSQIADPAILQLVIKGCARGLNVHHESIMVSGELQRGVVVEPRGGAATWGEAGEYRKGLITILRRLASEADERVADAAGSALVGAMHGLLDDQFAGEALGEAVLSLGDQHEASVRKGIVDLLALYERTGTQPDRELLVQRLEALLGALPPLDPVANLRAILDAPPWEKRGEQLAQEVIPLIEALDLDAQRTVYAWLADGEVKGGWELGYAISSAGLDAESAERRIVSSVNVNFPALAGFLSAKVASGNEAAFDEFLDGPASEGMDAASRLLLTVRGTVTPRAGARIRELLQQLTVLQGARTIFGWQRNFTDDDIVWILHEWLPRVADESDYASLVDWVGLALYGRENLSDELKEALYDVVVMRRKYPDIQRERWEWGQLARAFVDARPVEMGELVLDLLSSGELVMLAGDEEAQVLGRAADAAPAEIWAQVGSRAEAEWRLQLGLRGWFTSHIPVDVIDSWIAGSVEKARIVAALAGVGGSEPAPLVRLLLGSFGDDERVRSSLAGEFISGSWMGNESARLASQIDQLKGWRTNTGEPLGVRKWAGEMIEHLEASKVRALEREAEEYW